MDKYLIRHEAAQVPPYDPASIAHELTTQLAQFLFPLLVELDERLDKRLVRTCVQIIAVILTFRDRANGLLLSELGGYLLSPDHAPAGTKRLSNLLHSPKWTARIFLQVLECPDMMHLDRGSQIGSSALLAYLREQSFFQFGPSHRLMRWLVVEGCFDIPLQ